MIEKNYSTSYGSIFLGLFLALGLILSSTIISKTILKVKLANQTLKVKGYAARQIRSDLGLWRAKFIARSHDLVSAYDMLERDLEKILSYLEKNGIKRQTVDISSVFTSIRYKLNEKGYTTNEIEGYILEQEISINSSNVNLISKLSKESTSLIKEGIEFISYHPQFFYTKINDLKIEMLGEASKDARKRAEQLAVNSNGKVGQLRHARQGVFQITPVNSTDVSDYGTYDTRTIDKSIKAVVTVEYSIQS